MMMMMTMNSFKRQLKSQDTFILSRIRTCCLIVFIFDRFYVLSYCKVTLAALLCKGRRHRSSVMMMMNLYRRSLIGQRRSASL